MKPFDLLINEQTNYTPSREENQVLEVGVGQEQLGSPQKTLAVWQLSDVPQTRTRLERL